MRLVVSAFTAIMFLLAMTSASQAMDMFSSSISIGGSSSSSAMQSIQDQSAAQMQGITRSLDTYTRNLPVGPLYDPNSSYQERLGIRTPGLEALQNLSQQNQGLNDSIARIVQSANDAVRGTRR